MISVGDPAPDFEVTDQDGRPFRLSSLRGAPVVLYFYPKADTPGCTVESKGFQAELSAYAAKGVRVIGVSVDDAPAQKAFAVKCGLAFPLLADTSKAVAESYGVLGPRGTARRVTFLLEPDGTVGEVIDAPSADRHLDGARARFLSA